MRKTNWFVIILITLLVFALLAVGGLFWYNYTLDRSGWMELGSDRCYLNSDGEPVIGWQEIDGSRYYFRGDTTMATHWLEVGGKRYYFGDDGAMSIGWTEVDGQTCYFGTDGVQHVGWLDYGGERYYLPEGVLATGWQDMEGKRYYFGTSGALVTGSVELDGIRYSFREDGSLISGWENGLYYLQDGSLATGWQDIDGKRYYFNEDGTPYTGWLEEGEYRYYLLEDGSAAVGPYEIDGYTYHFTPKGIQIWLINGDHLIPEFYTCETQLTEGGVHLDKSCVEAFAAMFKACQAAGNAPRALVGYRSYWDQLWIVKDTLEHVGPSGLLYVAQPNASEHQLGLAVDVIDSNVKALNSGQEYTSTFKWFQEHCWEYGFILRYLNGTHEITGVGYEPWHYRYVGVEVAMELKELGITLEEYLGAA